MSDSQQTPFPPQHETTQDYPEAVFNVGQYQRRQDEDQLRLLAIFHYVMGAMMGLTALIPLIYVGLGIMMLAIPAGHQANSDPPPVFVGYIFMGFGLLGTLICGVIAGFTIRAGSDLSAHRGLTLIQVMACINCLHMPIGTVLGVFTLIVVNRPSVRALFERGYTPSRFDHIPEIDRASYQDR